MPCLATTCHVTLCRSENLNLVELKLIDVHFFQYNYLVSVTRLLLTTVKKRLLIKHFVQDKPFKDEAQTALVKDPVRTAQ